MMAVLLALPVHADTNVSLNYVWDGTQWIPWLATSDGRPKVDINLFNISAGSANISGNFTVDTGTLFVDSLNNRVGIGTSTPQHTLHVNGTLNVTGASYLGTSSIDAGNITTDRLGIGISGSPNQALQIVGHANISGTVWSNGMNITPNNVSLLYGWNNTDFIPLLTTGAGVLKLQTEQALAENANTLLIGGNGTDITINASGTGARPLIVRGFPGQTVNLTEWRNSANTVNAFVTHFGGAYFNDSVGIGTAVPPGTILDVLDSGATGIRIRRSVGNADTRMFSDTSIGYLGTQSNHPLRIQTNAVDRVTIDTSGNVGIGTVAPRRKLQINGSAGVSLETNESVYLAIGENQKVGIGLNMTSPLGTVHINSSNALGALRIENTTGTQLLFINGSSGNVGIGTTVPSAILDVVGNVELNGNVTGIDDITLSDVTDLTNYITGPGFRSLVIRTGDANDANDELGFEVDTNQADPGVTYTRVMTMDWTGNVGIGTTSPYRRLQVNGTGGALEVNDSVYLAVSGGNVGIGTATLDTDTRLQVDRSTVGETARFRNRGTDAVMNISLVNDAQTWGIQVDGLDSDKFKIVDFQPDPDVTVMTFVKSTGNVGIGTTVPANTLTVNSSSNRGGFEVTNATDSSRFFVNASSGNIGIGTASPFSGVGIKGLHVAAAGSAGIRLDSDATSQTLGYTLWQRTESGCAGCFFISNGDATSDYVTIDTTGNLGIGTASPGERLDVRGNMTITENLTVQRNLTVQHNLSVGGSTLYVNSAAGNVGIGTTSPGAVVHVLGGAVTPTNARFLQFGQASTTTADISAASAAQYGLDLRPTMKMTGDGTSHFGQVIEPYSIDDGSARTLTNQYGLYISAGSKGASTTITNVYGLYVEGPTTGSTKNVAAYFGGNVGIGTTSPASTIKLEVNGTIRVYKTIQVLDYYGVGSGATISTAGPQGGMNFTTDSGLESGISFSFVTSQGSAYQPAFSITANRKAAVNTLAGAAGNSLCYDTTTVSGMNTFATCSSSRRYKENIEPLSVDKDKVFQLQPVSFKWKNRNESSVGLIAEDVEPVIPELVGYYNGQIESVEYKLLTVYLLDIAKEQDKNITMLNNANMALRLAVQKLEEKNSNMEADVGLLRHEVEKLKIQSNGGE